MFGNFFPTLLSRRSLGEGGWKHLRSPVSILPALRSFMRSMGG